MNGFTRGSVAGRPSPARRTSDLTNSSLSSVDRLLLMGLGSDRAVLLRPLGPEALRAFLLLSLAGRGTRPLTTALRSLARSFSRLTGIWVRVAVHPHRSLSEVEEDRLFRVGAETLLEIERDSRAEAVVVSLSERRGTLRLRVADDGVGMVRRISGGDEGLDHLLGRLRNLMGEVGGAVLARDASPTGVVVEAVMPRRRADSFVGRSNDQTGTARQ